jgi:hypothetical protein
VAEPFDLVSIIDAGGLAVTECTPVHPSLEDVFLDVAERSVA